MAIDTGSARSRRALLAAAAGAAVATVATAIDRPAPVRAGTDGDVVLGAWNTASRETKVDTLDTGAIALHGNSATDGWAIYGSSDTGIGVLGECPSGYSIRGTSYYAGSFGVSGENTNGTGVYASSWLGNALQVAGKAKFSRSGRATVLKGKYYVDITVAGGLASSSMVHATLQTYHSGVAIAAVRRNYPVTGKARIYLTKVASTTSSTYVGWFVAEY